MTREEIYLGSFLHDIGKFYQRADGPLNGNNKLSDNSKNLQGIICPVYKGFPSHQHVIWTHDFFEKNTRIFQKFIAKQQLENIIHAAAYHHRPDTPETAIVQLADWWASGMDRSSMGLFEDPHIENTELRFREIPLNNILCALRVKHSDNVFHTAKSQTVFHLKPLSLYKDDILPGHYSNESKLSTEKYHNHWKSFIDELGRLGERSFDFRGLSITLFYLLKKYTWCIPSFTQDDHPCISLFEHSKITGAIAQCLFDVYKANPDNFKSLSTQNGIQIEIDENTFPLLLAGFDLSGIQDYLYNISSANAAKSLRGRSFYLQMTMEALAWKIINEAPLQLTPSHIIYASGGKFYLLLPNIPQVKEYLNNFHIQVLNDLWDKHRGRLYLNMGMVAFRYKNKLEAKQNNIRIEGSSDNVSMGELWNRVFEEITRHEAQRFRHIIASKERFADFFEPSGEGGNSPVCNVTGEEIGSAKEFFQFNEERRDWIFKNKAENYDAGAPVISPEVHQQIKIGQKLVDHNFIAFSTSETKAENYFDLPGGNKLHIVKNVSSYDEALILKTVHNEVSLFDVPGGKNQAIGFRFFGGSQVAMEDKNTPATFEYLAGYIEGNNKGRYPFKRLAILRMDVDGLGSLFRYGLTDDEKPTELASFSAYATFSNLLDLFFSGYLNTLREKYKDDVNILYSGGDDVFALGYWEKIIAFADDVRSEFRKFAARDDITLSAGIELVGAKFPVAKGAEIAGEAEEKAKQHKIDIGNGKVLLKNALCFLGVPLNWDHEWPKVKNLKEKLVQWVRDESITRGFLMQLISYYETWKYNIAIKGAKEYHNWKWQAAYNIARRQKNLKEGKNAGANEALEELKQILFTEVNEKRMRFEAFAVACRWAELTLRNEKEK